jgi:hypothetical protein
VKKLLLAGVAALTVLSASVAQTFIPPPPNSYEEELLDWCQAHDPLLKYAECLRIMDKYYDHPKSEPMCYPNWLGLKRC